MTPNTKTGDETSGAAARIPSSKAMEGPDADRLYWSALRGAAHAEGVSH